MVLILLFVQFLSLAQELEIKQLPWAKTLIESKIRNVHACGNANIQPTKKSLKKNFFVGPNKFGFLFSGLISKDEYFSILNKENLESAKNIFMKQFRETRLWQVKENGDIKDLGSPIEIELPFISTVKDCMEGAKTSLGNDCSIMPVRVRSMCCQEKFAGPRLKWIDGAMEYRLMYSPDPSIRLKIPNEKKHRYCDVQKEITL